MTTFTDDFNRADSTNLGAGWVEVSGDWSIVSNQLSPGAAGGTIILRAAGAMAGNDNYAQATIAATTAASQGVWCRGNSNISQGYLWRNNGTSWDLFQVVGGSFTNIGTYAAAAVPNDVAKIQAVGTTIKGYVNGVQRVSVTDTAVTSGTSVGIRSDSAGALRYDDFAAGDVTAGAALGIATSTETAQPLTGAKAVTLGIATETGSAQTLAAGKVSALGLAGAAESAQALTGAKSEALSPAVGADAAQVVTGAKAEILAFAAALESAQEMAGTKTDLPGMAAATETAQPLANSKAAALGGATETDAVQVFTGVKMAPLPAAAQIESAQPLAGATSRILDSTASLETAWPLSSAKTAILGTATEYGTARPLAPAGPDVDLDVTVGAPYSPWSADAPQAGDWKAGAPW